MLPACSRVLIQKVKRTKLITKRWLSSTQGILDPEYHVGCGWSLDLDSNYKILWFEGSATPETIDIIDASDNEGQFKMMTTSISFMNLATFFNLTLQNSIEISDDVDEEESNEYEGDDSENDSDGMYSSEDKQFRYYSY